MTQGNLKLGDLDNNDILQKLLLQKNRRKPTKAIISDIFDENAINQHRYYMGSWKKDR